MAFVSEKESAVSVASSAGLSHGTNTPVVLAISAIAVSSVDTIISYISDTLLAASIDHTIRGLSPSKRLFFPGQRLDPPLARIKARIFILDTS